ncbi:MAG: hypothetical protein QNJ09_07450 [Paracoccaceae bacterium]|nr:hypothetical protein [Paracoccaceae bacterium]
MLDAVKISEYAHALYRAHGDAAEAEAARRQQESNAKGDAEEAETWRKVRQSISQMRGPNQG